MFEIYSKTLSFSLCLEDGVFFLKDYESFLERFEYEKGKTIVTFENKEQALTEFEKLRSTVSVSPAHMRYYYDVSITIYYLSVKSYISVDSDTEYCVYQAQFDHNFYTRKV